MSLFWICKRISILDEKYLTKTHSDSPRHVESASVTKKNRASNAGSEVMLHSSKRHKEELCPLNMEAGHK